MKTAFTGLVSALSAKVKYDLKILDGVRVHVNFDDFALLVEYLPEAEQVLLAASVAEVPPDGREALYRALLQGQFLFVGTKGASLALDPEESFISLQVIRDMSALTLDNFPLLVEGFLNEAEKWSVRCQELTQKEQGAGKTRDNGLDIHRIPGMLRV